MLTIRRETNEDMERIRLINIEAFGGGSEAGIVEKLRKRGALIISLVAVRDGEIVGHIAFSPAIVGTESSSFEVIALAPMAVLPAYQHQGIGSQLVRQGLEECRKLGYVIVVLVGHADYYPRFGFVPSRQHGLKCEFEVPDDAWMVLELCRGALVGRQGTVRFQPEFKDAT